MKHLITGLITIALAIFGLAGLGAAEPASKFDKALRARAAESSDDAPLKVIVTLRPGAKRGLVQALKAQRARLSNDFSIIEAFSGDLPAGLVRLLEKHPDVLSISSDVPVRSSAVTSSVSGNATRRTTCTSCGKAPMLPSIAVKVPTMIGTR